MESITPDELLSQGFTEDMESLKRFEHPFKLPTIVLAAGFILLGVGIMLGIIPFVSGFFAGIGVLVVLFQLLIYFKRSTPRSRFTGKPLKKYFNAVPENNVVQEIIYVCEESKTFYRRVWGVESETY